MQVMSHDGKCITPRHEYDVSLDNLMVQISPSGNHFIKCSILVVIITQRRTAAPALLTHAGIQSGYIHRRSDLCTHCIDIRRQKVRNYHLTCIKINENEDSAKNKIIEIKCINAIYIFWTLSN